MTTNRPTAAALDAAVSSVASVVAPVVGPPAGAGSPQELCERFADAARRRDVAALVALYAGDAVVSLPRGREAAGHAAIRAAYEAALGAGLLTTGEDAATTARVVVAGPLAMTSSTDATGTVRTQVARREADGTWLWVRDGSRLRDADPAVLAPPAVA